MKETVVFDFDGVIHSYKSGWCGIDKILDEPTDGIDDLLKRIKEAGYRIVIVSSRCREKRGIEAIKKWLEKYDLDQYIDQISMEKVPASVYIDDRAIRFDGKTEGMFEQISTFEPWTKKMN